MRIPLHYRIPLAIAEKGPCHPERSAGYMHPSAARKMQRFFRRPFTALRAGVRMTTFLMAVVLLAATMPAIAQTLPVCQAANPNSPQNPPPLPLTNAIVNVLKDCDGVVGDGHTDDWFALQSCINNNPGKHIVLPKTQVYPESTDYYVTQTLTLCGDSQWLSGETAARYTGATQIKYPEAPVPRRAGRGFISLCNAPPAWSATCSCSARIVGDQDSVYLRT